MAGAIMGKVTLKKALTEKHQENELPLLRRGHKQRGRHQQSQLHKELNKECAPPEPPDRSDKWEFC